MVILEVGTDLGHPMFHPPLTGSRVAPGAEVSVWREYVQIRETNRQCIESERKRDKCRAHTGRYVVKFLDARVVNPGEVGGDYPQILGRGVVGRVAGVSWGVSDGSWNIIISYHVQEVCSKLVTFEEKYNNLPRSSCKWPIFDWKIEIFCEIAWKNRNFRKFAWKNRNVF